MAERTFAMDLAPLGRLSCVLLDGEDISGLLRGVDVSSSVEGATTVKLHPAIGHRVELIARVPDAQITVVESELADLREAVRVYDEQARQGGGQPLPRYFDAVVIAAFRVGRA
jgi:hypothetical protein